ncbi:MAG: tocopherol cyclase family protein [Anaerolineae bacterium]
MPDLRSIWRPALYHGRGKQPPFFEGWYFKLVDAGEQHRYAVIPGVFIGREPGASHAFVQTLDGATGRTAYHRYPFEAFQAARDEFDIRVGPNRFRADRIELDIDRPEGRMAGELRFAGGAPWPVTLTSPGIMGPYTFAPFMECYHGVLSFDHSIAGSLSIDGAARDFTGGRGYIEKDWGQAFPKAWIWMQSNHFGEAAVGACLTASVAIIPWLRGAFPGFIVGLRHGGQLYRFATYTGAVIERLDLADTHVTWHMTGRTGPRHTPHRLEIVAWRAEGGLLHSPERVVMLQRVLESLTARIDVRLLALTGGQEGVIFERTGRHAGLEIVGPIQEIQKLARLV